MGGQRHRKKFSAADEGEAYRDALAKKDQILDSLDFGMGQVSRIPLEILATVQYHWENQTLNKDQIVAALMDAARKNRPGQGSALVQDLVVDYLENRQSIGVSDRHMETLRYHFKKFTARFKNEISKIKSAEIDQYLRDVSDSPKTRFNHRASIMALFNYAKRKGLLPHDQKTQAELTEVPRVRTHDPKIFTPEELRKLLKHADETLQTYLVIAAFAGMRNAEACRLQWKHWKPEHSSFVVSAEITKTLRRRTSTVEPNLVSWLERLGKDKDPESPILPKYATNVNRALAKLANGAGVRWKQNGLRHSYASYHLELYKNAALTSKNCGHSIRMLENVYAQITNTHTAEQWFSIRPDNLFETN